MIQEIKDCKTWAEAERWLAKHGWGLELIALQKLAWDEVHAVEDVKVTSKPKLDKPKAVVKTEITAVSE